MPVKVVDIGIKVENTTLTSERLTGTVGDRVSEHQTSSLEIGRESWVGIVGEDCVGQSGDIDSAIALSCDPEGVLKELGIDLEKVVEKQKVIHRCGIIVGDIVTVVITVGKSDSTRRLDVDHVGLSVPGVKGAGKTRLRRNKSWSAL